MRHLVRTCSPLSSLLWLPLLASTPGCAVGGYQDAGGTSMVGTDAGARDGGARDAGPRRDGAPPLQDAGPNPSDAGPLPTDAGPLPTDAGPFPTDAGGPTSACVTALLGTVTDFETSLSGWSSRAMDGHDGDTRWTFDPWEYGIPSPSQATAFGGSRCLATDLDENYVQCGRAEARTAAFNLSACAGEDVYLVMEHSYDFWTGSYASTTWFDGGLIEVSTDGGSNWMPVDASIYPGTIRINPDRGPSYSCFEPGFYVSNKPGFVGNSGGWQHLEVPLPAAVSGASAVRIRFAWASGVSSATTSESASRLNTRPGWFIDDLRLEAR